MVANTQARNIAVTINGTDYSQYLTQLEIGFESYSQGTGIVYKKGKISLASIAGGISLDPRDNADFVPGAAVTVTWNANPHPVGASLFVLSSPTADLLDTQGVFNDQNIKVEIPVGCTLAHYRTREFDSDQTGVTYGNPLSAIEVIGNLLVAAEVPAPKIGIAVNREVIGFPYTKNGGGFVDLAGVFAYSTAVGGYPSYLYCDTDNTIRDSLLDTSVPGIADSRLVIVTLGTNDREYLPQLDIQSLAGIVQVAGVFNEVVNTGDDFPYSVTEVLSSEGRTDTTTTTYYRIEKSRQLLTDFTSVDYYESFSTSGRTFAAPFERPAEGGVGWTMTGYQSKTVGLNGTSEEWAAQFYKDDKLTAELLKVLVPSSNYSGEGGDGNLVPGQYTFTEYEYDGNDLITSKVTTQVRNYYDIAVGRARGDIKDSSFSSKVVRGVTSGKIAERWDTRGSLSIYSKTEYSASRIINPTEAFDEGSAFLLKVKARRSNSTPRTDDRPATTYWDGLYQTQEQILREEVTFGNGSNPNRYSLQVPIVFGQDQVAEIAAQEGRIINGRQYQFLIECDPGLMTDIDAPLRPCVVVEGSTNRAFLMDALTWVHTQSEDYVGFAGIYLGIADGDAAFVSSQSLAGTVTIGGETTTESISGILYG